MQATTFDETIELIEDAVLDEPLEVRCYYIPNLEYTNIVSVFIDDKMLPPSAAGSRFQDIPAQKAFFVQTDSMLFKESVYKMFPGGAFAKIDVIKTGLGKVDRRAGSLWQAPAFKPSDLISYFKGFGCKVTMEKLTIQQV